MFLRLFALAIFITLVMWQNSLAKVTVIPEVEVVGEAIIEDKGNISIKSEALPAQVQVITDEDLEKMNVRHYWDIFRKTPGVAVINMGQGDAGDRLGTRGFWAGFAIFVDGVPLNMPHHNHLHGLADSSWLVPEMIERVEVIKGPFSALYGNFALGGVINIITKRSDKSSTVGIEAGSYDSYRGLASFSKQDYNPPPFLVYEAFTKNGYRDNSHLERYNLFNKLTFPIRDGKLSIRASYTKRDWGAAGYLPVDDVKQGVVKKTDAVNPTDGGYSEYYNLVFNYTPKGEAGFHGTLYASKEDFNRIATFTPSPQRWEHNERTYFGWNLLYNYMPLKTLSVIAGTDGRYDDGKAQRFNTVNRQKTGTIEDWDIKEFGVGLFLQAQYKPLDFLKIVGGVRYDWFNFDVENRIRPQNSGSGDTSIVSPKIGFVITPMKNLNIFANKGLGFRTPFIREMSPTDRDYKNFTLKPAKVDTWDLGFNTFLCDKLHLSFDYFQTDMEREIRAVGADVLNIGQSKRDGYEIEARFYATDELSFYGSYSWVKGRIKNPAVASENRITNMPESYTIGGIEWTKNLGEQKNLTFDIYTQVYGKTPLNSTGSIMRGSFEKYYSKISYRVKNTTIYAGAIYHPKDYISEGEFIVGGKDVYDPRPRWDLNAGIKYHF